MGASKQFRATKDLKIQDRNAGVKPLSSGDKERDKLKVQEIGEQIATMQDMLYSEHKRRILVILQGMDTSGKDGTVRDVFRNIHPLGVRTVAYKAPTQNEADHDFLWRVHAHVPGAGEIVIFNRSHYEDVLITRVHGWIDDEEAARRITHIRNFENLLADTGTVLLKFFLHISKEEQRERLQARIDDPAKHWKFDPNDLKEREYWSEYQKAYQQAIVETDADHAPWYVIPSDSKTHRNLAVASIVLETLEQMRLTTPPPNPELRKLKIK